MPVLAKVSWQIGQLASKITLQLMKQISPRQVISPALLLLALSPRAERILHKQDCAFRTQTSNSSWCLLKENSVLPIIPTPATHKVFKKLRIQNSLQWPMTKKSYKNQDGPNIFLNRWCNTNINQKSDFTTVENQSLSRTIDMFSDTNGSHTKHHATSTIYCAALYSTILSNHP